MHDRQWFCLPTTKLFSDISLYIGLPTKLLQEFIASVSQHYISQNGSCCINYIDTDGHTHTINCINYKGKNAVLWGVKLYCISLGINLPTFHRNLLHPLNIIGFLDFLDFVQPCYKENSTFWKLCISFHHWKGRWHLHLMPLERANLKLWMT